MAHSSPGRGAGPGPGVMMLEYTARAAAADLRSLAMPMAVPSVWASLRSHASLVARTAELVVAVRTLRIAGRTPAGAGVRALFDAAALVLPAGTEDRAFGRDVEPCGL
ncbi:MAG: hypothetical protein ACXVHB_19365 [Solirubrobacteraceae bacterium]